MPTFNRSLRCAVLLAAVPVPAGVAAHAYVTFALNPDGSIDQVKLAPAAPEVDFSFDFRDLLLRPFP